MNRSQLDGKICLVTGATDGMGKATAMALAQLGGQVLLVGRNPEKGAEVVREIQKSCGHDRVELLRCDLSSQSDIRALTERVNAQYPRLDVLVNNASGVIEPRRETLDGIEYTWAGASPMPEEAPVTMTTRTPCEDDAALMADEHRESQPGRPYAKPRIGHQAAIESGASLEPRADVGAGQISSWL
jgi:NAD(P)-dependent dehydrogenase (short-subunit alcohol dehydrogenase family)